MRRSRVELGLGQGGLELKLHEEKHKYIEAKSIEAGVSILSKI